MIRFKSPNGFRQVYTGEYQRKRYERDKERKAAEEEQETEEAVLTAPRYFNIQEFLSSTFERNYCLQLLFREKGTLIRYLHDKGASEDQLAATVKILEDITKE
jgi:hypothetical protein